jgi:hypothetical protein
MPSQLFSARSVGLSIAGKGRRHCDLPGGRSGTITGQKGGGIDLSFARVGAMRAPCTSGNPVFLAGCQACYRSTRESEPVGTGIAE